MKIRIKKRAYNIVEGKNVHHFEAGDELDLPTTLAERLIESGHAVPVAKRSRKTHSESEGKGK